MLPPETTKSGSWTRARGPARYDEIVTRVNIVAGKKTVLHEAMKVVTARDDYLLVRFNFLRWNNMSKSINDYAHG
jgi:hypothetical protein